LITKKLNLFDQRAQDLNLHSHVVVRKNNVVFFSNIGKCLTLCTSLDTIFPNEQPYDLLITSLDKFFF